MTTKISVSLSAIDDDFLRLLDADDDFEPILSLAALAYERKTGKGFDCVTPLSYETYTNKQGWELLFNLK